MNSGNAPGVKSASCLLLLVCLFLSGCGDESGEAVAAAPYPEVGKSPLIVIHHDGEGELINYLALENVPQDLLIEVKPKEGSEDLYVTVLGTKRHALLKRSFSISTKVGDGYLGKIEVIVEKGLAVSVNGNGMHSPGLISDQTLKILDERLGKGESSMAGESSISVVRNPEE